MSRRGQRIERVVADGSPARRTIACAVALAAAACSAALLPGCDAAIGEGGPTGMGTIAADAGGGGAPLPDASLPEPPPPDAAVPPADAAAPVPCVEGDLRIQDPSTGSCYLFFATPLPWVNAQAACAALGGHLASSTSLIENAFLSQIAPSDPPFENIWIGASDQDSEGAFTWVTGELFQFDHWRSGEPNNGGDGENCAVIEGDNNLPGEGCLWDDRDCGDPHSYLCERP